MLVCATSIGVTLPLTPVSHRVLPTIELPCSYECALRSHHTAKPRASSFVAQFVLAGRRGHFVPKP